MPDPSGRSPWGRVATALALILGAGLGAFLVYREGPSRVLHLLLRAWWGLAAAIVLHLAQIVLTGLAWRTVLPDRRPSGLLFIAVRWMREGVNRLLPVLPIAGVIATIRVLVRRGLSPAEAAGSSLVDSAIEIATQIPFTLLGLALLAATRGAGTMNVWMLAGMLVMCALTGVMVPARRLGLARLAERGATRLKWLGDLRGLDAALQRMWSRPRPVAGAGALHMASWMLGAGEVWFGLWALGHRVGAAPALVIESLGQAIRIGGLIVPGAVGVQEGGYILLCGLFSVPAAAGLALSLIARLRDIAFGVPSLAAWFALERSRPAAMPVAAGPLISPR